MVYKLAKIRVTSQLLQDIIGLPNDMRIVAAQVSHDYYRDVTLEFIVEGNSLPDDFIVKESERIKLGEVVHTQKSGIKAEVRLA